MVGVATLGLGMLQTGGDISQGRVALPQRGIIREPPIVATAALLPARVLLHALRQRPDLGCVIS